MFPFIAVPLACRSLSPEERDRQSRRSAFDQLLVSKVKKIEAELKKSENQQSLIPFLSLKKKHTTQERHMHEERKKRMSQQ